MARCRPLAAAVCIIEVLTSSGGYTYFGSFFDGLFWDLHSAMAAASSGAVVAMRSPKRLLAKLIFSFAPLWNVISSPVMTAVQNLQHCMMVRPLPKMKKGMRFSV